MKALWMLCCSNIAKYADTDQIYCLINNNLFDGNALLQKHKQRAKEASYQESFQKCSLAKR